MNRTMGAWLLALLGGFAPLAVCDAQRATQESIQLAELRAAAVQAAVEQVRGVVVQVRVIGEFRSLGNAGAGAATGLLLDRQWVLTSSFGLENRPEVLLVVFEDGATRSGSLVSIDHGRKTALLRLAEPAPYAAPMLQSKTDAQPGETAIAIGAAYSPSNLYTAVGIVSATGRFLGRAVQTDAACSPANYGGPLVDLQGRVIGMLTPLGQERGQLGARLYDSGIGFAVPLGELMQRLPRMREGHDLHSGRAGLGFAKGNPLVDPPRLARISPEGPAAVAGLAKQDVIVSVGGVAVATQKQFQVVMGPYDAGDVVTVDVRRGEETRTFELTLVAQSELKEPEKELPALLKRLKIDMPNPE